MPFIGLRSHHQFYFSYKETKLHSYRILGTQLNDKKSYKFSFCFCSFRKKTLLVIEWATIPLSFTSLISGLWPFKKTTLFQFLAKLLNQDVTHGFDVPVAIISPI